jgi:hypothetical protein
MKLIVENSVMISPGSGFKEAARVNIKGPYAVVFQKN